MSKLCNLETRSQQGQNRGCVNSSGTLVEESSRDCRERIVAMEQQQQAIAGNASSPTPPTSSASSGSMGGGSTAGGNLLTSTADSVGTTTGENSATVLPPRRRLGKIAARALSESKREGVGGPPGFGQAASPGASPLTSPGGASGLPGVTGVGAPGNFRERVALRSLGKVDLAGEQHGIGGSSKPGRLPHANSGPLEARHLGRRPEVNMRRHEAGQAQKYAIEQQAKRAALVRAQQSGSAGNFKTFDSSHNNYLIPVIPIQFAAKQ